MQTWDTTYETPDNARDIVGSKIPDCLESLRSAFSGTSFPTVPDPVAGQRCYRTDLDILFCYLNGTWTPVMEIRPGDFKFTARHTLEPGFVWPDGSALSRATYALLYNATCVITTGNTANGNPTITNIPSTAAVAIGMPLSGTNIPNGAAVLSKTSTTITMTLNASGSATAGAVVVAPHGVGDGVTTFNVPDLRGRAVFGRDDMGGTAANRINDSGTGNSGIKGVRLGAAGGDERTQAHGHPGSSTTGQYPTGGFKATTGADYGVPDATGAVTIASYGAGGAQNMPPASIQNVMLFAGV